MSQVSFASAFITGLWCMAVVAAEGEDAQARASIRKRRIRRR